MFTFQYAKNPTYCSVNGDMILITVKFEEFSEEIYFTATSFDVEQHGVDLFNRAKAGEFGEIQPFVPAQFPAQPNTVGTQSA